jgi:hypothetical protein
MRRRVRTIARWTWNTIVPLSALLCIATAASWIASYHWEHAFSTEAAGIRAGDWDETLHAFDCNCGHLYYVYAHRRWGLSSEQVKLASEYRPAAFRHNVWRANRTGPNAETEIPDDHIQYGFGWMRRDNPLNPIAGNGFYVERFLLIPHWALFMLFVISPLIWLLPRIHWRYGPGRCRYCGYDLRATPDRCPECGRVPRKKPAAIPRAGPPASSDRPAAHPPAARR